MRFVSYRYQYHRIVEFYFQPTTFLFGVSFEGDPINFCSIYLGPLVIEIWKFWMAEE